MLRIDIAPIARVHPAAAQGLCAFFWALPIGAHQGGAAQTNFARCAYGLHLPAFIQNLHLHDG